MNVRQFTRELFARIKSDWYMPVTEHQIYDTTERVIGSYMGKPLYRKAIGITLGSVGNSASSIKIADRTVEELVYSCGFLNWVSGANSGQVIIGTNAGSSNWSRVMTMDSAFNLEVAGTHFTNQTGVVILEYTKTTDTATTSKVPFEPLTEYSTEERMIGYWIDGKPLYRKVIETPYAKNIKHGIDNVGSMRRIVDCGFIMQTGEVYGINYSNADAYTTVSGFGSTDVSLSVSPGWANSNTFPTVRLILEYTKTTD